MSSCLEADAENHQGRHQRINAYHQFFKLAHYGYRLPNFRQLTGSNESEQWTLIIEINSR